MYMVIDLGYVEGEPAWPNRVFVVGTERAMEELVAALTDEGHKTCRIYPEDTFVQGVS